MVLPSIAPISYSPRAVSSISFRSRFLAILHLQQIPRVLKVGRGTPQPYHSVL
jgi:hypothetical protein